MNSKNFDAIVLSQLDKCKDILTSKNKEYSSETDRLHNFKVAARVNDTTPAKALWGMFTKHLVSVMDLVEDPSKATSAILDDKITDFCNYALLLRAILEEENEASR